MACDWPACDTISLNRTQTFENLHVLPRTMAVSTSSVTLDSSESRPRRFSGRGLHISTYSYRLRLQNASKSLSSRFLRAPRHCPEGSPSLSSRSKLLAIGSSFSSERVPSRPSGWRYAPHSDVLEAHLSPMSQKPKP